MAVSLSRYPRPAEDRVETRGEQQDRAGDDAVPGLGAELLVSDAEDAAEGLSVYIGQTGRRRSTRSTAEYAVRRMPAAAATCS
jgi:hypothetical protein